MEHEGELNNYRVFGGTTESVLRRVLEQVDDLVMITDIHGIVTYVNPAFEKVTGFERNEVLGKKPTFLKSGKHDHSFYKNLWDTILAGKPYRELLICSVNTESRLFSVG